MTRFVQSFIKRGEYECKIMILLVFCFVLLKNKGNASLRSMLRAIRC